MVAAAAAAAMWDGAQHMCGRACVAWHCFAVSQQLHLHYHYQGTVSLGLLLLLVWPICLSNVLAGTMGGGGEEAMVVGLYCGAQYCMHTAFVGDWDLELLRSVFQDSTIEEI